MNEQIVDRLVVLVVAGAQSGPLTKHLRQAQFPFTVIDSSGGVINEPVVCMMLGVAQARLDELLGLARQHCQPYRQYVAAQVQPPLELAMLPVVEVRMGGALAYVMNVERFEQYPPLITSPARP